MSANDHEQLEADLARLRPAQPPAEFLARLTAAAPVARPIPNSFEPNQQARPPAWWPLLRRLVPAAGLAVLLAAALLWLPADPAGPGRQPPSASAAPALKADKVEINQQLVSTFDAVGRLPGGEPVRFRCREWTDQMVLRDTVTGIVVEQRTPRFEIVAVGYDTY